MVRQVESLAADLAAKTAPVTERIHDVLTDEECASAAAVYLTGDGDSYHAACAAEMSFESLAGVNCQSISALRFTQYAAPWLAVSPAARPVVIAISAAGKTPQVVQAIEAARTRGALTVAITGVAEGPVARAAGRSVVISLPAPERSPGIRTYQASLLGLMLTAIRLGEGRRHAHEIIARQELAALPAMVAATAEMAKAPCRSLASLVADSPVLVMTGSGPSYGTALFSAAKMTEGAGVFATGQDLEEWCHVESLADPADMPVFVIAPPGRSHKKGVEVAAIARRQGRRLIAITDAADTEVSAGSGKRLLASAPGAGRFGEAADDLAG